MTRRIMVTIFINREMLYRKYLERKGIDFNQTTPVIFDFSWIGKSGPIQRYWNIILYYSDRIIIEHYVLLQVNGCKRLYIAYTRYLYKSVKYTKIVYIIIWSLMILWINGLFKVYLYLSIMLYIIHQSNHTWSVFYLYDALDGYKNKFLLFMKWVSSTEATIGVPIVLFMCISSRQSREKS